MRFRTGIVSLCVAAALISLSVYGCVATPPPPSDLTGDAAAGQTDFTQLCSRCHTASILRGRANQIVASMGTISVGMRNVTLTDQQVTELKAFAATQ